MPSYQVNPFSPNYGWTPKVTPNGSTSTLGSFASSMNEDPSLARPSGDWEYPIPLHDGYYQNVSIPSAAATDTQKSTSVSSAAPDFVLQEPAPLRQVKLAKDQASEDSAESEWRRYLAQPAKGYDSDFDDVHSEMSSIFDFSPPSGTPISEAGSDTDVGPPRYHEEPNYRREFLFSSGGMGDSFTTTNTARSAFNPPGFVHPSSTSVHSSSKPSPGAELRRAALSSIYEHLTGTYADRNAVSDSDLPSYAAAASKAAGASSREERASSYRNRLEEIKNTSKFSIHSTASAPARPYSSAFSTSKATKSLYSGAKSAFSRSSRAIGRGLARVAKRFEDPRLDYDTDFGSSSGSGGEDYFTQAYLEKDPLSYQFGCEHLSSQNGVYTSTGRPTSWQPHSWI
ncbi:hypothetical protein I317_00292 [Kwoniella heveanensis CBS 569]|nr:hypothetical protein I317_00292 [Kwoniella heveanensis CBS 569]